MAFAMHMNSAGGVHGAAVLRIVQRTTRTKSDQIAF